MRFQRAATAIAVVALLAGVPSSAIARTGDTTLDAAGAAALCQDIFDGTYATAATEPLAACQWDMALINADAAAARSRPARASASASSTAAWTSPSGHQAPNLDLADSCSFIFDHDPTALPVEMAGGDCSDKAAVQDRRPRHAHRLDHRGADQRDRHRRRRPGCHHRRHQGLFDPRATASPTPSPRACGTPATCGSTWST